MGTGEAQDPSENMAGTKHNEGSGCGEIEGDQQSQASSSFVWDEDSKLYYHASSGFYHDPSAGWYYSSSHGLYYTYEDGKYVPLPWNEKDEGSGSGALKSATTCASQQASEDEASGITENAEADGIQNPPSEWLEETLIDLYLSGYSDSGFHPTVPSSSLQSPDISLEEENWQAQYGQVVRSDDEGLPSLRVVDLWDWEIVTEPGRKSNSVSKLIGRTVRSSSKLHPSVPTGRLLKTAAIHEVHLDLVRVVTGKIYRLKSPSRRYLASVSSYDSSNPTRDWGFTDLYASIQHPLSNVSDPHCQTLFANEVISDTLSSNLYKHQNTTYKDRAAARRMLHGDFSIGPGQKYIDYRHFDEASTSSQYSDSECAAAEAIEFSFGNGSYARRILKSMGWNDGEALGNSRKGIVEPLRAVSNKGCAGLGWKDPLRNAI